jgi:hypothetical protein
LTTKPDNWLLFADAAGGELGDGFAPPPPPQPVTSATKTRPAVAVRGHDIGLGPMTSLHAMPIHRLYYPERFGV